MNKDFERCCSFLADMIIKYATECIHILRDIIHKSGVSFILHCIMEKVLVEQRVGIMIKSSWDNSEHMCSHFITKK